MLLPPCRIPESLESLDSELHFLIFFENPMPKDVRFRSARISIPKELMVAIYGIQEKDLPELPFEAEDPLPVVKKNAIAFITSKPKHKQ